MILSLAELAVPIQESMAGISRIDVLEDCLRVTTHCVYPSNGMVRVSLRVSGTMVIVSDDCGALNEAQSAGLDAKISDRSLRHLVTPYGASIQNGNVFATVPIKSASITAIFVANASRSVADWMYSHVRVRPARDFRGLLRDLLERKFDTVLHHDVEVAGLHKKHKFTHLITLPHGPRIIMDPVAPEAGSFNSRIVAHLDVREANHESLEQRMIYDDTEKWDAETLNLLSVGAIAIPFSRSSEALERLAGHT